MRIFLGTLIGILALNAWGMASPPQEVRQAVESGLQKQKVLQQQLRTAREEMVQLRHQLRQEKLQLRWTLHQQQKLALYLAQQQKEKEQLQETRRRVRQLRLALEPGLDQWAQTLSRLVAQDLPFLAKERQKRLQALQQTLDSPVSALSEKLQRLLEALLIEADYGQQVEATEGTVLLNGEVVHGKLLRIGRLQQFFLSDDRSMVAHIQPGGDWRQVDTSHAEVITRALEMVQQRRPFELVSFPLEVTR